MPRANPFPTLPVAGRPIHARLMSFSIACFIGTLATDIAYVLSDNVMWETFSIWLLTAGLVVAAFAVLAALIDLVVVRRTRTGSTWIVGLGNAIAIALSIVNAFVHSRDGYTAVVPSGLLLSGIVVAILAAAAWMARPRMHPAQAGVTV